MFSKKSRLLWGLSLLLLFLFDLFLLWKVGIVSLGKLDVYRDMKFGQTKDEISDDSKEAEKEKEFKKKGKASPLSESKKKIVQSKKREIIEGHGLNCVCKECRTLKNGRDNFFPIDK